MDIQQTGAGVKPVQMVFQQENGAARCHGGVVAAVAEEVGAVIEGDCQFLGCADFAIVIGQCFHGIRPPYNICSAILRATATPLAEAWDREWVMPLPSPMTYSPGYRVCKCSSTATSIL